RSIGGIAEEVQAEKRVVIKHPVGSAHDSFSVAVGIPGHAESWLKVIRIGLNALLQSQRLIRGKSQTLRRLELGGKFNVIAHAEVQGEIVTYAPGVLPEKAEWFIGERVVRAAETLYVISWDAKSIGLNR